MYGPPCNHADDAQRRAVWDACTRHPLLAGRHCLTAITAGSAVDNTNTEGVDPGGCCGGALLLPAVACQRGDCLLLVCGAASPGV